MEWCATHDMSPISAANRSWAEETFALEKVRRDWAFALEKLLP
jgi:hypothetical protein